MFFQARLFPGDHVLQKQKPLEFARLQLIALLPVLKTERVDAEGRITLQGQCHRCMMHRVTGQARGLALAEMPLAVVLMPDTDPRHRTAGTRCVGQQQVGGDPFARLGVVLDFLPAITVGLDDFHDARVEWRRGRPIPTQTRQKSIGKIGCGHALFLR